MPYDEQGNFYGSNEDLGELKAKYIKPDPVSQIPGQVSSSKPEESKSLRDRAAAAIMQYNPLMLRKSLGEASAAVLGGMALPVVAPISAGVQALNALPGNLLRRYNGEEEVKTPSAEDLMRKYGQALAPKTPLGQEMVEGVGKAFEASKLEGLIGMHGIRSRGVTPTDVRVGAGQIKQLAKELKETPRDFQAAQSGLKRQNLYGEDTIGVKAQAAADALGDTLERRRASDRSPIPGVPGVLTPETSMYAVRPKGSRLVQPKVPESAKNYTPEFSDIADFVDNVYGNVEAKDIPPTMLINEYGSRFLNNQAGREFKQALMDFDKQKALEMFPDAPSPTLAQRAYELLYSDRDARAAKSIETIEEFLALPENQRFVEAGFPTPSQFLDRYKEAERVIKGPLVNYISKNVGAEDDPTVKLARQGIIYETPERLQELERYVRPDVLAQVRTAGGFPAMGSFHEERMAKTGELDKLNEEIAALEDVRTPLFNRAHEEGIDPATIPEYAETTNPLRQKMRQREQLQGELENIKLATSVENLSDYAITPRTKKQMEMDIPYQERQFFPSITKGGENEAFYVLSNKSLLEDLGYKKLGIDLMEDILNGTAGDTSKLTVEKYIRDKHLTRVEAEKAAKLQQQQYRKNLEGVLLKRIQDDPNVKTFGNAAVITLNKDTPKEVALRDMSTDTAVLDHCVGQGGTAPQGRRNFLTDQQQTYEPIIDPVTGKRNENISDSAYSHYVDALERGDELISIRDVKTGLPAATIQLQATGDPGNFRIGYASGAKNKAIKPEYIDAVKQYLNSRGEAITSAGEHLSDNAGIFDLGNPRGRDQAIRAAGIPGYNQAQRASELSRTLELAVQNLPELPRFVTSDDVKKMFEQIAPQTAVVPVQAARPTGTMELRDYDSFVEEFQNALEAAAESAMEHSNLQNPARLEGAMGRAVATIFDAHLNDPVMFIQEPVTRLRRVERDLQNVIENAHAQRREVDTELATGLEDFLIDVRGLRASLERRLDAEQAPRERQRAEQALGIAQAPAPTARMQRENDLYQAYVRQTMQGLEDGSITEEWSPRELADFIRGGDDTGTPNITGEERQALAALIQEHGIQSDFVPHQVGQATAAQPPTIASFVNEVNRQDARIAERVETVLFRVNENTGPQGNFPQAIRAAAQNENPPVANFLNEYANRLDQANRPQGVVAEGAPIPPIDVTDLINMYGDRLTRQQLNWLQNFIQRWDNDVDTSPAGQSIENEMIEEYTRWRAENRLQPVEGEAPDLGAAPDLGNWEVDETHPANVQDMPQVANELFNMDVNRQGQPDIPAIENTLFALRNGTIDHQAFRRLPEAERPEAMRVVASLIENRLDRARRGLEQPDQQVPRIQVQDPVPREMQTLNRQDLILRLGPLGVEEAQRIAQIYFNDNIFNDNTPVSTATDMIRSYNFGPHEGQPPMVRELAARELEELVTTAQQDARILADALNEAMYQDMDSPEEAMRAAEGDIRILRQYGENAWEDVFGPMAEDYPWSRNTQERVIEDLRAIAREYRRQLDEEGPPFAKGGLVKRPMTPPVITRRSPELAEMQYRYGGMV